MAEAYSSRPSTLLNIEDPYVAWCLDDVTFSWGTAVDSALSRARARADSVEAGSAAATAELNRVLSDTVAQEQEDEEVVPKGRFRDPAADFALVRARAQSRRPQ